VAILRDREGKVAFAFALDVLGGQVQSRTPVLRSYTEEVCAA
jgi:hypothetical protein